MSRSSGSPPFPPRRTPQRAFRRGHRPASFLVPEPTSSDDGDTPESERDTEQFEPALTDDQLLYALRGPIEWSLTLARRLASGDPEDVAAVDRVRAVFFARIAGHPARLRITDVLILFGVFVSALDHDVVFEALSRTLGGSLATIVASQHLNLAAQLADLAEVLPQTLQDMFSAPRRPRGPTSP